MGLSGCGPPLLSPAAPEAAPPPTPDLATTSTLVLIMEPTIRTTMSVARKGVYTRIRDTAYGTEGDERARAL
jgi:hypothetical protein